MPYIREQQPSDLTMLGTGATLNLYLQPKRSSQVNFLVGFLPGNSATVKSQLTGDINLDLKNTLGSGESIMRFQTLLYLDIEAGITAVTGRENLTLV